MRKVLLTIFIFNCVWLCGQHSYKSPFRVGLKLGLSVHTLSGDLTESRAGKNLLGGFWFQLKMNKKWTAQTELLLIDKGIGVWGTGSPRFVNLHYFEIPVLFQYHKKMIYFEFGPGMGYMINYREHLYGNQTPELVNDHPFTRSELSFNLGMGCSLNEKWTIGLRLSHSLLPVRRAVPSISKESYNQLLALSLTRQLKKRKAGEPQEE